MRCRRGFSLVELVLAAMLTIVVGGFGLYSLSGGRASAESLALTEEILEELRAARQQAISRQVPVALAFPGAQSQSFYQVEGLSVPRVTRSVDYSRTYPSACFFLGLWGTGSTEPSPMNAGTGGFRLDQWTPLPRPEDRYIVFTPAGTVTSNGLPMFGGEYRLLVSDGVQFVPGSPVRLTKAHKAHTIAISQTGAMTALPGVYGGPEVLDESGLATGPGGTSLAAQGAPNELPDELVLTVQPTPNQVSDSSAVAIVPPEGYISLMTQARDKSGAGPMVSWEADGPGGKGRFSSDKPTSMEWDADKKVWTSRWNWSPPRGAADGEVYSLTCKVENSNGAVKKKLGAGVSVQMVPSHRIAAIAADKLWENFHVAWMNPEGTNLVEVTLPDRVLEHLTPVWSPNGDKLAFYSGKMVGDSFEATLYIVNQDGSNLRKLFTCKGDLNEYMFGPSFSPDGAHVTFSAYRDSWKGASRVFVCDTYGTPSPLKLTDESGIDHLDYEHLDVAWHPSKNLIAFARHSKGSPNESSIRVVKYPEGTWHDIVSAGVGSRYNEPHWARGGNKLIFVRDKRLFVAAVDGDGRLVGTVKESATRPLGVNAEAPRFANTDNRVAVLDYSNDKLWVVELNDFDDENDDVWKQLNTSDVEGYNWSDDGTEIVYASFNGGIFVVDLADNTRKNVTPKNFQAWHTPSWWAP